MSIGLDTLKKEGSEFGK